MVGRIDGSEMKCDRRSNRMYMMRFRATVVLLCVVEIQDYLLARSQLAQRGQTTFN
jgi:hypothetical protein